MSNRSTGGASHPGIALVIGGERQERIRCLAIGNGIGQPPAARCLFETLLAMNWVGVSGPGRGGERHHG